jgi:hypothetical protein
VPPPESVLEVAETHLAQQRFLADRALARLSVMTRRGFSPEAWRDSVAASGDRLLAFKAAAAALADSYVTAALDRQGATPLDGPELNPEAFADLTDGGVSWTRNLVYAPISVAQSAQAKGLPLADQVRLAKLVASSIVLTGMQDTGRSAVQAAMWSQGATGYVRMINPPSCARCVILAGRRYKVSRAFLRHPNCDCRMIPAAEDSGDWTTNPKSYFRSLSAEEQDQTFTKAGARAIRDGANMNQVVNARRGVSTVRSFGRDIQVTSAGTTTRAVFGGFEILPDGSLRKRAASELQKLPGNRLRTAKAPRLTPDEIYRLADEFRWDRAEVLRQLRRFGYLL